MSSKSIIITVAGASGNLAQRIIRELLARPNVEVQGYARNVSKIPEQILHHERFTAVQGQAHDAEKARQAVRGASVVICAYQGYDDIQVDGQKVLIDACVAEGVERYFASDWTLDYTKLELGQIEGKDCMIKIKAYLQQKPIKSVHILNGCFIETWLGYMDIWEPKTQSFAYWGTGDEQIDVTSYDDAAAFTAAAALDPTAEGILRVRGDCKSVKEVAQIYERVYGVKPKLINRGTLQQLWEYMHAEKAKHGDDKWAYMVWFYQYYTLNGQTLFGTNIDNGRYPEIKMKDFETFFRVNDISDEAHRQRPQ